MFEEFGLTYPTTTQRTELPNLMQVGCFDSKVPLLLPFDVMNGLCFKTNNQSHQAAIRQMQYIALSLLEQMPTDLLQLTFVDIGLNTNFPLIHSLSLPNIKFITNPKDLEEKIENLFKIARFISSKCLGDHYKTLKDYNKASKEKEPYNILFIANFPKDLDYDNIKAICEFINNGMKSGIYVVMNLDNTRLSKVTAYNEDKYYALLNITKTMVCLDCTKEKIKLENFNHRTYQDLFARYDFVLDNYPPNEIANLIEAINRTNAEADNQSEIFLSIPIGTCGKKHICLEMGSGKEVSVNHGSIAGGNETGKTTLLHNIITTIADKYSPDELRLFLMDFKGVDFTRYKDHPNVEFLLNDRNGFKLGLLALQYLKDEMDRRQALYNEVGDAIDNITQYNKKSKNKLPRILIIIDEVQKLFVSSYQFKDKVNDLLSDIVRQGRGFGLHVILSSQTFRGVDLESDVKAEMPLRIAFRLSPDNCGFIMEHGNDAPAELEKYKIIYNNSFGIKKANMEIQLYKLDKEKLLDLYEQAKNKYKDYMPFDKLYFSSEDDEEDENEDEDSKLGAKIIANYK